MQSKQRAFLVQSSRTTNVRTAAEEQRNSFKSSPTKLKKKSIWFWRTEHVGKLLCLIKQNFTKAA